MRRFEKVSYDDKGIIPTRADDRSAGYDFYSIWDTYIPPHRTVFFDTYIKAYMDKDEVLMLYPRSSLGIKKHLSLANSTGVIDSSYVDNADNEGNIIIALHNYGDEEVKINGGDRIAQGVFIKYLITDDDQPLSNTRTGGIGSSGN